MSEGAAEGGGDAGGALSDGQFGDVTGVGDVPVAGDTTQNPGTGIFAMGYYAWGRSQNPRPPARHRRKRKHRR